MTHKPLKLPKGIIWEGNSTYVEFVFRQLKCREKIPYLKPDESGLTAAEAFKSIDRGLKELRALLNEFLPMLEQVLVY